MINAGTIAAFLTLNTNGFSTNLSSASKMLSDFVDEGKTASRKWISVGNGLQTVGGALTKYVSLPLVGLGATAVKTAISMESSFAGVRKTVDATEVEYRRLEQAALDITRRMPQAAETVHAVMEAAGQLGIQNENIMSFTETMIMLGDATNMSADTAATTLARFANITQMSQKDFDRLGSTIVELGNNFATTESEIAAMGLNIASAGKQVGLTEAQIMGFATALSSVGMEAQAGGTAISKLITDMYLSTQKGGKDLKQFADVAGMSAIDFKKAFEEDAAGAMNSFFMGLNDTERLGKSAIKILDEMGIHEQRLSDAIRRLAGSGDLLTNALEMGTSAWDENTALVSEAEKRYATTASQIKILWNEIKALAAGIGQELLPMVKDALQWALKIVGGFAKLDAGTKKTIVQIGLLAASMGPLLSVGGKVISTVGKVGEAISTANKAAKAAEGIGKLTAGLGSLISPAGAVVVALAAVSAGAVILYKKMTELDPALVETRKRLDDYRDSQNRLQEAQEDYLKTNLVEVNSLERLRDRLADLFDANGNLIGSKEQLTRVCDELSKRGIDVNVESLLNESDAINTLIGDINNLATAKRAQTLLDATQAEYDAALSNRTSLQSGYTDALNRSIEAEAALAEAQASLNEANSIQSPTGYNTLALGAEWEYNKAKREAEEAQAQLDEYLQSYFEALKTIENWESAYEEIMAGNMEAAIGIIEDGLLASSDAIKKASEYSEAEHDQAISDWINETAKRMEAFSMLIGTGNEAAIEDYKKTVLDAADQLRELGADLPEGLVEGILGYLQSGEMTVADALYALGTAAGEGFNFGLDETAGQTTESGKALADALIESTRAALEIASPSRVMFGIGANAGQGLINGLESMRSPLLSTAASIAAAITSTIQKALEISSPSRVMFGIGAFAGKGLELGLSSQEQAIREQAAYLAKAAVPNIDDLRGSGIYATQQIMPSKGAEMQSDDRMGRLITLMEDIVRKPSSMEIDGREFGRVVRQLS